MVALSAYVDEKDDVRLRLKYSAILFGQIGRTVAGDFYAVAVVAWSIGRVLLGKFSFHDLGSLVIAAHLAWQAPLKSDTR